MRMLSLTTTRSGKCRHDARRLREPRAAAAPRTRAGRFRSRCSVCTLWIKPAPRRLTPEWRVRITEHRAALKALVLVCDDGVQDRVVVYKAQLAAVPAGSTPDFVFQRGTAHTRGVCFSCASPLSVPEFGRCWRCSFAWRLDHADPDTGRLGGRLRHDEGGGMSTHGLGHATLTKGAAPCPHGTSLLSSHVPASDSMNSDIRRPRRWNRPGSPGR